MGFEEVANNLQDMGYKVAAGLFSAEEVGASHGRSRLFIMADSLSPERKLHCAGDSPLVKLDSSLSGERHEMPGSPHISSTPVLRRTPRPDSPPHEWDKFETRILRSSHGNSDGMDDHRIRCCGNGVVPLAAAYAWTVLGLALQD
jgi:DNA (cytosine-5)-methyltransferase 1